MLVRFEISAVRPVTKVELDLDDSEPALVASFNVGAGEQDGRYFRAMAFKPVINGTFNLTIRAYVQGAIGAGSHTLISTVTCPGVTVTP
jgi:hypothetical protein